MKLWSFIPPDQIGRLWRLNDADHDYFVDGSPTVYYGASQKILVIGSRRGGESYTALDITNYSAPRYLYSIGPGILGPTPGDYERLGQSWSRPDKVTHGHRFHRDHTGLRREHRGNHRRCVPGCRRLRHQSG